jgi:pectinesterase
MLKFDYVKAKNMISESTNNRYRCKNALQCASKTFSFSKRSSIKILIICSILILNINCKKSSLPAYNAIVSVKYVGEQGAIIDGVPIYNNIAQALAAAPVAGETSFVIYIRNGKYYEKLSVDKANIHLIGESRDGTIITFDTTGESRDPAGEFYGTWGCFTLQITAAGFRAENLTIENSFDYPANALKADDDPTKIKHTQAVALMTTEKSDRAVFKNCKLTGYQDTVFANAGRSYFYQCEIAGHVDFIFGAGQAVFDQCDIISRNRHNKNPTGYITAPSTSIAYPYGFLFTNCRLIKENSTVPKGSVCLGRPWHPGADLSVSGSAVFMNCFMDDHIGAIGYTRISSRDSTGRRIWFDLEPDSRFFEYGSHGPGAISSPERPMLDENSVKWYTVTNVLNGWAANTSANYY